MGSMPSAADLTLVHINRFKFVFNKIVLCLSSVYVRPVLFKKINLKKKRWVIWL